MPFSFAMGIWGSHAINHPHSLYKSKRSPSGTYTWPHFLTILLISVDIHDLCCYDFYTAQDVCFLFPDLIYLFSRLILVNINLLNTAHYNCEQPNSCRQYCQQYYKHKHIIFEHIHIINLWKKMYKTWLNDSHL